jgi:protein-L-isoaspartate(D-aspartate) O-methyltransferase
MSEARFAVLRRHMVEVIAIQAELASEELGKLALDPRVLAAMANLSRHLFVPSALASLAYHDAPLPIGLGKTISQPFVVAVMTDLLAPLATDRALEVGHRTRLPDGGPGAAGAPGVERRGGRGAGARGRGAPGASRISQRRHPHGRRLARLGGEGAQPLTVLDKDAAGRVKRRALPPVRFGRLETMA